jgi:beta-glucosidase
MPLAINDAIRTCETEMCSALKNIASESCRRTHELDTFLRETSKAHAFCQREIDNVVSYMRVSNVLAAGPVITRKFILFWGHPMMAFGLRRARNSAVSRAVVSVLLVAAFGLAACDRENKETTPSAASRTPAASAIHPEIWPKLPRPAFDDSAFASRLEELLKSLSVEEKVGQVMQGDINSVTPDDVRKYRLGSVLNGGNSGPYGNDFAPAKDWLALADAYYEASMDTSKGGHAIPIIWGVDAVHGNNNIVGATIFPHNIGLGAARNPELIRRIGEITAIETRVTGQEWTFAPTLAVVQDARWGRTYESYSERPEIVHEYAKAMVIGLQGEVGSPDFLKGNHVMTTAKHYVGDGGTFQGRDQGDNRATEEELRDIHSAGYMAAIPAGAQSVMASFSGWQGVKVTGHKGLLTDVLKTRFGFDGILVSDWNAHGQVEGCTNASCAASINAGLDMYMAPDSWKDLYESTVAQVKSGVIPMERLDDAVRRILRVKLRAGLFEAGKPSSRHLAGQFKLLGAPEHRAVARQAVRESLVLLKNSKKVLPLKPSMKVLVAGDGADNFAKQNGGWSLTWQGTGVTNAQFPNGDTVFAGIRAAVNAGGGKATLSPKGSYTSKPDVAIVVFGEDPYAEFQGDVTTLEYRPGNKSDLDLLKKLRADNIPVVSVFISGRPMWVNPELNASDAFVAAWLPGTEGGGIADVLFAKRDGSVNHDFRGKLSFAWPSTPDQVTATRGDAQPLFAYGFGLNYQSDGELAALPEDVPGLGKGGDASHYFSSGRPTDGWRTTAGEADGKRAELTAAIGSTSSGALKITGVDLAAQEDARQLTWSGSAPASWAIERDEPIDLQREANGQLSISFDVRLDAPPKGKVTLAMECAASGNQPCRGEVQVDEQLRGAPVGQWHQAKILLSCFQQKGASMQSITAPLVISSTDALQLSVANVKLDTGLVGVTPCP